MPTQIPSFGAIQHQNPQAFYTEFDLSHNPLAMSSIPPSVSNHSAIIPFDFSLTEAVDEANLRHFLNGAFPTSTDTPDAASTFPSALAAIGQSPPPSHHLPADGLLISSALPYNQQDDFLGTNDPGFEPGVQQPGQGQSRFCPLVVLLLTDKNQLLHELHATLSMFVHTQQVQTGNNIALHRVRNSKL